MCENTQSIVFKYLNATTSRGPQQYESIPTSSRENPKILVFQESNLLLPILIPSKKDRKFRDYKNKETGFPGGFARVQMGFAEGNKHGFKMLPVRFEKRKPPARLAGGEQRNMKGQDEI